MNTHRPTMQPTHVIKPIQANWITDLFLESSLQQTYQRPAKLKDIIYQCHQPKKQILNQISSISLFHLHLNFKAMYYFSDNLLKEFWTWTFHSPSGHNTQSMWLVLTIQAMVHCWSSELENFFLWFGGHKVNLACTISNWYSVSCR